MSQSAPLGNKYRKRSTYRTHPFYHRPSITDKMAHFASIAKAVVFVLGIINLHPAAGKIWAQFCDDTACAENCGISIDVTDPDCLRGEGGRQSLRFHGSDFLGTYLVHSPDSSCGCQQDCTEISRNAPPCIDISGKASSKSYRFQISTCKADEGGPGVGNNCKPTNNVTSA
ncbi:hypothetical protein F4811DRAFT_538670 [Daldinia bambusicola]|nr:hypothetical protein F4811DRAFT_538670 [Daldinia bambusicola]